MTRSAPDGIVALAEISAQSAEKLRSTSSGARPIMRLLSKVLWREGMHLTQHHFQAQSRYVEDTLDAALGQLCFQPYGLTEVALDEAALRNGTVLLTSARGIMPDGLPFHMPDSDPLPEPRDLGPAFSPAQLKQTLLLAIAPRRTGMSTMSANGGGFARYSVEQRAVRDAVNGRDERVVEVARKNLRLVLDSESNDDAVLLPIARIQRDGAGHFVTDPTFVPPCTKIGASTRLMNLVATTLQMVEAKSAALASSRDEGRADIAEYAAHEVANFWLLHTLRANSSLLRHHYVTREAHPERLYVDLVRFVGALSTFVLKASPTDVPRYEHEQLSECFAQLERLLRSHLEVVVPTRSERFALEPVGDNLFAARIDDERCYRRSRWIIGLRSSLTERAVLHHLQLLKVCSRRHTLTLVQRSFPGLALTHLAAPPSAISPRADTYYFALAQDDKCWKDLVKTRELGMYVPDVIADPKVDLHVIVEDS